MLIAEGAVAAQLNVPAEAKLLRSGSGGACLVEYGGESAAVSALGPEGVEPLFTLDGTETQAFDGTEEFFLICADAEAAYGLDETAVRLRSSSGPTVPSRAAPCAASPRLGTGTL